MHHSQPDALKLLVSGYPDVQRTPAVLVHESRILHVTLFGVLQSNSSFLDFSLLLPDVIDHCGGGGCPMDSYMNAMRKAGVA